MVKIPNKVMLNGADCFLLMLERKLIKYKAGNNIIRMVVTVSDEKSWDQIKEVIETSQFLHWIANIRLITPWMMNPYWRYTNEAMSIPINYLGHISDEIPEEIVYTNFDVKKNQLLRFDTFFNKNNERKLVISFHHILLDGRGSGLLVRHLTQNLDFNESNFDVFFPTRPKRTNFFRHVINMFQVKKYVERTMKKPLAHLPNNTNESREFNLTTYNFTLEETKIIDQNAKENGARFGTNLYQIACTAYAFAEEINFVHDIWVPVPYDGRKRGSNGPVVSNNISFLFYRLKIKELTSINEIVGSIQTQMNEQLKLNIPSKYNELLQFMRFIPKGFYFWMTTRAAKGEVASFLYSSSGESFWDTSKFSNEVKDTLLIPPFTYPPGISITFLRNDGKLKMNIVASSNKFNIKQLSLFENNLKELLLNADSVAAN